MNFFSYIIWAVNPEIFPNLDVKVLGDIRWYGMLFALGFILSQQIMFYIFKKEGRPERDVETLTIFMIVATILGARLGHVLFYEPEKYVTEPWKIFFVWEGGLASHGGAIGILIALYLYSNYYVKISFKEFTFKKQKREGQGYLWILDRIVIVVALTGACIRFGNFMNSEIIGKPTGTSNGVFFARDVIQGFKTSPYIDDVTFSKPEEADSKKVIAEFKCTENLKSKERVEELFSQGFGKLKVYYNYRRSEYLIDEYVLKHIVPWEAKKANVYAKKGSFYASIETEAIPRHPAQLYEAISCLLLFFVLFAIWNKKRFELKEGMLFGIFLIVVFGLRFVYEFYKENQVAFEDDIPLNMGQWLSIPLVIVGFYILFRSTQKTTTET